MSSDTTQLQRAKFHAYLDEQLREDQYAKVEALLDQEPDRFEELQHCQLIAERLHELYDVVLSEPVPSDLYQSAGVALGASTSASVDSDEQSLFEEQTISALDNVPPVEHADLLESDIEHAMHDIDDLENLSFNDNNDNVDEQKGEIFYENGIDYPYDHNIGEIDRGAGYNAILSEESADDFEDDALDYAPFDSEEMEELNNHLLDQQSLGLDEGIGEDIEEAQDNASLSPDVMPEFGDDLQEDELALNEDELVTSYNDYEISDEEAESLDISSAESGGHTLSNNEINTDDEDTPLSDFEEANIVSQMNDINQFSDALEVQENSIVTNDLNDTEDPGPLHVSDAESEYLIDSYEQVDMTDGQETGNDFRQLEKEYSASADQSIEVGDVVKEFAAVTHEQHFGGDNSQLFANPVARAIFSFRQGVSGLKQKLPNFQNIRMPAYFAEWAERITSRRTKDWDEIPDLSGMEQGVAEDTHAPDLDSYEKPRVQQTRRNAPVTAHNQRPVKNIKPDFPSDALGVDVDLMAARQSESQDDTPPQDQRHAVHQQQQKTSHQFQQPQDTVTEFEFEFQQESSGSDLVGRIKSAIGFNGAGGDWRHRLQLLAEPVRQYWQRAKSVVMERSALSESHFAAVKWIAAGLVLLWIVTLLFSGGQGAFSNDNARQLAVDTHVLHAAFNNNMIQSDAAVNQSLLHWIGEKQGVELKLLDLEVDGFVYTGTTLIPHADDYFSYSAFVNKKSERIGLVTITNADDDASNAVSCSIPGKLDGMCSWVKNSVLFVAVGNISLSRVREFATQVASLK